MSDYISRDEIFSVWRSMPKPASISSLTDAINRTPTADVEPVRHGRWGKKQGGFWEFAACSLCGEKTPTVGIIPNFCPSCGAKMDLKGGAPDDP